MKEAKKDDTIIPDAEIKELMERTMVQSFRLPDGNDGKCCIVFNQV